MGERKPWTEEYICTVHERPGDHPDEATCGPRNFVLQSDFHAAKQQEVMKEKWPEPRTGRMFLKVTPVWAVGTPTGIMVENLDGERYPVDIDLFHRRYRAFRPDLKEETVIAEVERILLGVGLIGDPPPPPAAAAVVDVDVENTGTVPPPPKADA